MNLPVGLIDDLSSTRSTVHIKALFRDRAEQTGKRGSLTLRANGGIECFLMEIAVCGLINSPFVWELNGNQFLCRWWMSRSTRACVHTQNNTSLGAPELGLKKHWAPILHLPSSFPLARSPKGGFSSPLREVAGLHVHQRWWWEKPWGGQTYGPSPLNLTSHSQKLPFWIRIFFLPATFGSGSQDFWFPL